MNLKKILIALVFANSFIANAQNNIVGYVKNSKTNENLQNANVIISYQNKTAITNSEGKFEFQDIPSIEIEINVSYVGFESYKQKMSLTQNQTLHINLEPSSYFINEVIINSTRSISNTSSGTLKLNKNEIKNFNDVRNITNIIEMTPSVITTSDAGTGVGYTSYRIRGIDETRINVTINGVPLNDAESQGAWFVNLPDFASSVDNMEINRGVGTSTNGAGAFGGSLNFETNKLNSKPYTNTQAFVGSFNTSKLNINFGSGLLNNVFAIEGRFSNLKSDGYVQRASANLSSNYLSAAAYLKNSTIKFITFSGNEKTYQAWDGIPSNILDTNRNYNGIGKYYDAQGNEMFYDNEIDNYKQSHYQLLFAHSFNSKIFLTTNLHYSNGYGYYEQYKDEQSYSKYGVLNQIIVNDTITQTDLIRRKILDNNIFGGVFSLKYNYSEPLLFILGGAINKYTGNHLGRVIWMQYNVNLPHEFEYYKGYGEKIDANIYLKTNYNINSQLSLWLDIQERFIDYKIWGIDDQFRDISQNHYWKFFNPKMGANYLLNENNNFYFSFGIANREPTRSILVDAIPTQRPTPETLYDIELGHNFNNKNFVLNSNLYYMKYNDQLVLTGNINDVGAAVLKNVENSYRLGVEISSNWKINDKFSWQINATFSQNKILDFTEYIDDWDTYSQKINYLGTTDIAFSPNIIAANVLNYSIIKNLKISLLSKFVDKQFIDNTSNNNRTIDSYFVNNIMLKYSVYSKYIKQIDFQFNINNIFNHQYETNAWVYSYFENNERKKLDGYFPQSGINFLAGVYIDF